MSELDRLFDSLFRNTIGFDYLNPVVSRPVAAFPRYDVMKVDQNHYVLEAALAGYRPEEIDISWVPGNLTISSVAADKEEKPEYLHRGIAKRDFRLSFALPEHVEVEKAEFDYGLLRVFLTRVVPEALQPKRIPVQVAGALEYQPEETEKVRKLEKAKKTA